MPFKFVTEYTSTGRIEKLDGIANEAFPVIPELVNICVANKVLAPTVLLTKIPLCFGNFVVPTVNGVNELYLSYMIQIFITIYH